MHTHIAVINADNKVVAVVKLGLLFNERLKQAIQEETGEEVEFVALPRETPSPELIRYQVQIDIQFQSGTYSYYLAPTWEY